MMIKIELVANELELELLLSFDGGQYQASEGCVVDFTVRGTDITAAGCRRIRTLQAAPISGRRSIQREDT